MDAGQAGALFEHDRPWLEKQVGMQPWIDACTRLDTCLRIWVREYCEPICREVPRQGNAQHARYQRRLWNCWAYHWQQAAEVAHEGRLNGEDVARSIRAGRGYVGQGQLGGDPLEDVVLAEAVQGHEPAAIRVFEQRHKSFAIGQGVKANREVVEDPDDWWYLLLDELGGYSRPPGKLERFAGQCGLRNWLGTVARNYARQAFKKTAGPNNQEEELDGIAIPDGHAEKEECLELLAGVVETTLRQLPRKHQLLLYLLHVEQLAGKEVAYLFQIHPGNISRRKEEAAAAVRDGMLTNATQFIRQEAYDDCLELLTQQRNWQRLADIFYETLRELGEEGFDHIPEKESGS